MQKFSFDPQNENFIRHNIEPEMLIQIIINDNEEYDVFEDVYELFEFRGNKIVVKWYADEDEVEEIEDFSHIRSILRRAWSWYKSQVYIKKKEFVAGVMEDESYILEPAKLQSNSWILTDKQNLISIVFENRKFNETQKIVEFEDFNREQIENLARTLRLMGDWLAKNHSDKVF
jgi:hypothetical protein